MSPLLDPGGHWAPSLPLRRILLSQFSKNPHPPSVSDHPQYLITLASLQQEFCWVSLTRLSLTPDVFSVIFHSLTPTLLLSYKFPLILVEVRAESHLSSPRARPHCSGSHTHLDVYLPWIRAALKFLNKGH